MDIKQYLDQKRRQVEESLQDFMPQPQGLPAKHVEAMRYSLFAGGKRIRPILCLAAAEAVCGGTTGAMPAACALECIHTYSLIHDDLPAMDNDDFRRGKPTNHKVFGEAAAILAGDGLLTFAFELLSRSDQTRIADRDRIRIINLISQAAGSPGMVGGQVLDIDCEGKDVPFETLRTIHSCKTGALITAAVQTGAVIGQATSEQFEALTKYGKNIGLAFQIVDDLLNVEGSMEELGKAAGSDAARQKATYPGFFGLSDTKIKAREAANAAINSLHGFDDRAEPLRELADYVVTRKK